MSNGYRTLSQHLNDLKKENFSLKLRIYFLEERMQQKYEASREDIYKRVSARGAAGTSGCAGERGAWPAGQARCGPGVLPFPARDLGQAPFTLSRRFAASFSAKRGNWVKSEPGAPGRSCAGPLAWGLVQDIGSRLAARMRTE